MRFNTFVFDLDGPLLDGKLRHHQCYADILTELNYIPMPCDRYWDLKRNRINRLEQLGISSAQDCYAEFLERWLTRIEEPHYLQLDCLQPGVISLLSDLRKANKQIILATMRKNKTNLFEQLENVQIKAFFTEIVAIDSDDPNVNKGDYVKAILANKPGDFLWIGDTEIDVKAAKSLNIPVAVVSNGLRTASYLTSLSPDFLGVDAMDVMTWAGKNH